MAKKTSGSGADTIIKLVLIFFISLLSFSVGTFVGKQVSDADYRKAAIEGDYDHFQAKNEHDSTEKDHSESLSDDEIASLTEEFVNTEKREIASTHSENSHAEDTHNDSHSDGHGKKDKHAKPETDDHNSGHGAPKKKDSHHKDEHASADADGYKKFGKAVPSNHMKEKAVAQKDNMKKHDSHSVAAAAHKVASGQAPSSTHKEKRQPTSVLPGVASSAVGKFTVQVASYAEETEAKAHSSKLKTKGWNAFYIPAEVKGRTWYRVSVGLFSTTASAEKFKTELKKEANISSAYVQKIVK